MSRLTKFLTLAVVLLLTLTLAACGNKDVEEKLQDAYNALILAESDIVDDIDLPTKGKHDVEISWKSSNEDYITNDGKVTRPEHGSTEKGYVVVTLTATLKLEKKTKEKEFTVRVMELPEEKGVTVGGVLEQPKDTDVVLRDVIVFGVTSDGFYVYDETGTIFVYMGRDNKDHVKVGDKVDFYGTLDIYYNQPQVSKISGYTVKSSNNTLTLKPKTSSIAEILDFDSTKRETYAQYLTIEGIVQVEKDGNYTNVYIVEGENKVQINPNSDDDKVQEFDGKRVSIDVLVTSWRTDRLVWYLSFFDHEDAIREVVMTDEEKLDAAYNSLNLPEVVVADLELRTDINGVKIVWTSSNEEVISTNGKVTRPETDDVEVTLTAKLTIGDLEKTKEIKVTVKAATVSTIADVVKNNKDGDFVDVEGYVAGVIAQGYFLYDGTSTIYVFTADEPDVKEGDQVRLTGKYIIYNDQPEIEKPNKVELTGDDAIYEAPTVQEDITIKDIVETDSKNREIYGKYVRLTGKIDELKDGNFDNWFLIDEDENKVRFYHRTVTDELKAFKGQTITIDVFVYRYSSNNWEIAYIDGHTIGSELTEEETLAQVKEQLSLPKEVTDALELPSKLLAVSITWTSDNDAITINEDGSVTVTRGDEDVEVTLTATLKIGELTDTKEIKVTVKASNVRTITDVLANAKDQDIVDIEGIVIGVISEGYFLYDGTGSMYIYTKNKPIVQEGDQVRLTGPYKIFYNQPEIDQPSKVETLTGDDAKYQAPTAQDITVKQIVDTAATEKSIYSKFVTITAKLDELVDEDGYTNWYLVDAEGNKVRIYYKSNFDEIKQFKGLTIKIDVFVFRNYQGTWEVAYVEGDQAEPQLTDQERLDLVLNQIEIPTSVTDSLELVNEILGVTITWESDNAAITINEDGSITVTRGSEDVEVTLTATLTVGELSESKEFTVTVKGEGALVEEVIYEVDFEEGFTAGTTYNDTIIDGPENETWKFFYGTPSTTSAISGEISAQMRWYTSAKDTLGYMVTQFTLKDVSKVEFKAKNTNGINVIVSYSTDGENFVGEETFILSTSAQTYTYNVDAEGDIYLKFQLTFDEEPTETSRLIIDDIVVYGLR